MESKPVKRSSKQILLNTIFWGFMLWFIGYMLGIIFFAFVSKEMIGYFVMPVGVLITLWVLFKKISRDSLVCYAGLGLIWTMMAALLDYIFIVKMFNSVDYYKLDVYVYYVITFVLSVLVGWYKINKSRKLNK